MPGQTGQLVVSRDQDEAWHSLVRLKSGLPYSFSVVDRQGNCFQGNGPAATEQQISLVVRASGPPSGISTVTIPRPAVLRVSFMGPVYSGRSSWSDLQGFGRNWEVLVLLKSGKRDSGRFVGLSGVDLTLDRKRKTVSVSKGDVAKVFYLRGKVLPPGYEYMLHEGGPIPLWLVDPPVWPYVGADRIRVPIYDSSMPEDNAIVTCKDGIS
jgi:hypothetical protein